LPNTLADGPLNAARDGLHVAIRLSPRAQADRLVAIAADARGGRIVKASVTAPAAGGRANEALLRLIANAWRLPRRDLSIIAGSASRNKAIRVTGDPQQLADKIIPEIASLPGW
jgi:uncharacterized protein (TIGR00251 family)